MYEGIYRFAEKTIKIVTLYPDMHETARNYRVDDFPEFEVGITAEDIQYELERLKSMNWPWLDWYTEPELEKTAVLRKTARWLADQDTLTFHSSGLAVDGQGYVFSATSGTGKSTHSRLWREYLGDAVMMINDDRPFIIVGEKRAYLCGSPWDGKHHLSTNTSVPLKGIAVLKRGEENSIRRMPKQEAWPKLFQQTYRPESSEGTMKVMRLLEHLMKIVPVWELTCNMEPDAARLAYETMSQEV